MSEKGPVKKLRIGDGFQSSAGERRPRRRNLALGEIVSFAYDTFCSNKLRFALTGVGMVIGTASLILVVTIGLTGKQYLLNLIQSIGSNEIWAEYQSGGRHITGAVSDFMTMDDLQAVQSLVPGVVAASPVVSLRERVSLGSSRARDIAILGVEPDYRIVRNLVTVSGRFFDAQDEQGHDKVGVITLTMARQVYGSSNAAIGQTIKLSGLTFTVIGVFSERVDTFGQTEVTDNTMLIPYPVSRYFTDPSGLKLLYFSVAEPSMVEPASARIKEVLQSRHRADSVYSVSNLTQLVVLASNTANALTLVLLAVSAVVLLVSGVGIMNIMLATVSERIREIGIRKALGATKREIRFQFLSEAILISVGGGLLGVIIGLAIPYSVRFLTEYRIPISGLSAVVSILISSAVGILFGTIPAFRAAELDPVESLRHE